MKKGMRGAKGVLLLFVIAAVVCSGLLVVFPKDSSAATSVKYNVEVLNTATAYDVSKPTVNNDSPYVTYQQSRSSKDIAAPIISSQEGITFQMLVDKKAKTEVLVVGKTKTKATYYPVTIIAKSFKDPGAHYQIPYQGDILDGRIQATLVKDAVGKLYISGGDVDVKNVQGEKTLTQKIGDGTVDPAGSLIIPMVFNITHAVVDKGVTTATESKWVSTLTTGQSSTLIKGSKSAWEGKTIPTDDTSGMLPKPMVGAPVDLQAGTGTLVCTECPMNVNVMMVGKTDFPRGFIWNMMIWPDKSTKPPYPTPTTTAPTTPSGSTPSGSTGAIHTGLDIDSTIGELVANPDTAAVIEHCVPGFTTNPQAKQAYGYTFAFIAPFDKKTFTPDVLKCLENGLAAIK